MKRRQILIAALAGVLVSAPLLAQTGGPPPFGGRRWRQKLEDAPAPTEPLTDGEDRRPRRNPRRYGQPCYMNGMQPRHRRRHFWDDN
ncbi:MAG: hypothetical protein DRQ37_06120 [Gammaproteobacteria bacterium]|nr:MAG: hypothetical protein DRQ37_06120 [Gammaproteobacteria bacterium]